MADKERSLGRYQILQEKNGIVVARDARTERLEQLVRLPARWLGGKEAFKALLNDLAPLMSIENESLQAVDDLFEAKRERYLVLRHVEAAPLEKILKELKGLSGTEVQRLINQIASALMRVHAIGAVHGNLTSENILVDKNGDYVLTGLTDCAVSRYSKIPIKYRTGDAPELVKTHTPDTLTDQYSLAKLAKELIDQGRKLGQIKKGEIPQAALDALKKAMNKHPDERYKDIAAFMRAFNGSKQPIKNSAGAAPAVQLAANRSSEIQDVPMNFSEIPPEYLQNDNLTSGAESALSAAMSESISNGSFYENLGSGNGYFGSGAQQTQQSVPNPYSMWSGNPQGNMANQPTQRVGAGRKPDIYIEDCTEDKGVDLSRRNIPKYRPAYDVDLSDSGAKSADIPFATDDPMPANPRKERAGTFLWALGLVLLILVGVTVALLGGNTKEIQLPGAKNVNAAVEMGSGTQSTIMKVEFPTATVPAATAIKVTLYPTLQTAVMPLGQVNEYMTATPGPTVTPTPIAAVVTPVEKSLTDSIVGPASAGGSEHLVSMQPATATEYPHQYLTLVTDTPTLYPHQYLIFATEGPSALNTETTNSLGSSPTLEAQPEFERTPEIPLTAKGPESMVSPEAATEDSALAGQTPVAADLKQAEASATPAVPTEYPHQYLTLVTGTPDALSATVAAVLASEPASSSSDFGPLASQEQKNNGRMFEKLLGAGSVHVPDEEAAQAAQAGPEIAAEILSSDSSAAAAAESRMPAPESPAIDRIFAGAENSGTTITSTAAQESSLTLTLTDSALQAIPQRNFAVVTRQQLEMPGALDAVTEILAPKQVLSGEESSLNPGHSRIEVQLITTDEQGKATLPVDAGKLDLVYLPSGLEAKPENLVAYEVEVAAAAHTELHIMRDQISVKILNLDGEAQPLEGYAILSQANFLPENGQASNKLASALIPLSTEVASFVQEGDKSFGRGGSGPEKANMLDLQPGQYQILKIDVNGEVGPVPVSSLETNAAQNGNLSLEMGRVVIPESFLTENGRSGDSLVVWPQQNSSLSNEMPSIGLQTSHAESDFSRQLSPVTTKVYNGEAVVKIDLLPGTYSVDWAGKTYRDVEIVAGKSTSLFYTSGGK